MSTATIAATRLQILLRNQGEGILDLQSSAKALLNHEFNDFPEERMVLLTVLESGLMKPLLESNSRNRAHILQSTVNLLEEQTGMHPEWARWAIQTWLSAIAESRRAHPVRHDPRITNPNPDPPTNAPLRMDVRDGTDPQEQILHRTSTLTTRIVVTLIVGLSGFLGAFCGRNLPVSILIFGFKAVDPKVAQEHIDQILPKTKRLSIGQKVISFTLYFFANGTIPALGGLAGASLGWLMGRSDGGPWMGVSACFSAGVGVNLIFSLLSCGMLIATMATIVACFLAGIKSAAKST